MNPTTENLVKYAKQVLSEKGFSVTREFVWYASRDGSFNKNPGPGRREVVNLYDAQDRELCQVCANFTRGMIFRWE